MANLSLPTVPGHFQERLEALSSAGARQSFRGTFRLKFSTAKLAKGGTVIVDNLSDASGNTVTTDLLKTKTTP